MGKNMTKTNLPLSIIINLIYFVQIKWFHETMVCLSLVALSQKHQQPPSDPA